jgi:hypothetical protein
MQNLIILLIVLLCAVFVGRRLYRNFTRSDKGCGCSCDCSGCGPEMSSICHPDKKSDSSS